MVDSALHFRSNRLQSSVNGSDINTSQVQEARENNSDKEAGAEAGNVNSADTFGVILYFGVT